MSEAITIAITVPSSYEERYGTGPDDENDYAESDWLNQLTIDLAQYGVAVRNIGGGYGLVGGQDKYGADNDFELSGDEEDIKKTLSEVSKKYERDFQVWRDGKLYVDDDD